MKSNYQFVKILVCMLILAGCGGGGGGGAPITNSPPVISSLNYSPTTAKVESGNGSLTIKGSFNFTDVDGDTSVLRIVSSDGSDISLPLAGISGVTAGFINGEFLVTTTTVGTYTFDVFLIDSAGNESNKLPGSYSVKTYLGNLDQTFGSNGVVLHDNHSMVYPLEYIDSNSILLDPDGSLFITGRAQYLTDDDMFILKHHPDGTIDTSFGNTGVAVHDNAAGGSGTDFGNSMVFDSTTQNIMVVGSSQSLPAYGTEAVIWRYARSTGYLNGNAIRSYEFPTNDTGNAITIDADGKILVVGSNLISGSGYDMVVWRYLSNGTLDTTFGNAGVVVSGVSSGGIYSQGTDIHVDANGKIVITGQTHNGSDFDMVVWRYNPDGTPDNSFGNGGSVIQSDVAGGTGDDYGKSIGINADGQIVVVGYGKNSSGNDDIIIWRFNDDGSLDAAFGNSGVVVFDLNADYNQANAFTFDKNGRILVTGSSGATNIGGQQVIVSCFNSDGSFDTEFASNNDNFVLFGGPGLGTDIAVDDSGNIYVTGKTDTGDVLSSNFDVAIWKII